MGFAREVFFHTLKGFDLPVEKMTGLKVMGRNIKALMFPIFIIVIIGKVNGKHSVTVYEAPRGQNKTLDCPVTVTSELLALYWRKNGINILYIRGGQDPSSTSDRYRLTGNTSLMITNIDRSDTANYTCTVFFEDGGYYLSDALQLYVTELSISHCLDTRDSGDEVDECDCYIDGNNVTYLNCTARGFPYNPAISWKLGEKMHLESSIVNLTAYSNNRTLQCLAQDPVLRDRLLNQERVCLYYTDPIEQPGPDWQTALLVTNILLLVSIILIIVGLFIICRRRSNSYNRNERQVRWIAILVTALLLVVIALVLVGFLVIPSTMSCSKELNKSRQVWKVISFVNFLMSVSVLIVSFFIFIQKSHSGTYTGYKPKVGKG